MVEYIKINNQDNVAVALCDLAKGGNYLGVTLKEDIAKGHKFALVDISKGQNVIKYGAPIGSAKQDISVGEHV
ncbi:MAG: UxaA family hydrolase, partial [Clostridia bacterium]|nr:UxaA family hydrolase [Clostridia bacterium]